MYYIIYILPSSIQLAPEDRTARKTQQEKRNSKNSSRPLALKVLLGHLGYDENSSESAIGYLGRDDRSRLGWLG